MRARRFNHMGQHQSLSEMVNEKRNRRHLVALILIVCMAVVVISAVQDSHRYQLWIEEQRNTPLGPYMDFLPYISTFGGQVRVIVFASFLAILVWIAFYWRDQRAQEIPTR